MTDTLQAETLDEADEASLDHAVLIKTGITTDDWIDQIADCVTGVTDADGVLFSDAIVDLIYRLSGVAS